VSLKEQLVNKFSRCLSNNCLEEISSRAFEIVDDKPELKLPCRRVSSNGEFKVKNPHGRLLHFLKIDHCILLSIDPEKRCDFAVFSDNEMIFVELKTIKECSKTNSKKRRGKRNEAYGQLENTLKIFLNREKIDLSIYQNNQKLFVIVSILALDRPTKMPSVKTANQNAQVRFEGYNAILKTGNIYEFL